MKNSDIEWIGNIPDHWQIVRLQWMMDEIKELNKTEKTKQILSLTNTKGVIPYEEKGAQGNVAKEDYTQYKLAYPNTIVVNSMNILIGSVGKCNYFGCVSPVYYIFSAKKNSNIDFLNYIFQTTEFQKELRRYANGILEIRLRVSSDDILKREIAIPSLMEQEKIVLELQKKEEKINKLIENQREQISRLIEYKQSVITEVVTKGLDPNAKMKDSGIEWIGQIPENWNIGRLKYVSTYNDDTLSEKENSEKEIKYVDIGSVTLNNGIEMIQNLKFKDAPSRARRVTHCGDIIVSTVRTYLKAIASIDIEDLIVSTGFCVIRPRELINGKYLEYFCKSNIFTDNVSANSVGISYPAINSSFLMNMSFIKPNYSEQVIISNYLNKKCLSIEKLIVIKQSKIQKLQDYKKSIIYEYVTGKKPVV